MTLPSALTRALLTIAEHDEDPSCDTSCDLEQEYWEAISFVSGYVRMRLSASDALEEGIDHEPGYIRGLRDDLHRLAETLSALTRPVGMSPWVTAQDVMQQQEVSESKAYEWLRHAAGRVVATGETLRVPLDEWETWARNNIPKGKKSCQSNRRSISTSAAKSGGAGSTTTKASSNDVLPGQRTKRRLGPDSPSGSARPLIPMLKPPKR